MIQPFTYSYDDDDSYKAHFASLRDDARVQKLGWGLLQHPTQNMYLGFIRCEDQTTADAVLAANTWMTARTKAQVKAWVEAFLIGKQRMVNVLQTITAIDFDVDGELVITSS